VYIPAPGWTVPDDYNAKERPWYTAAAAANGHIITTPTYRSMRSGEYQINIACRIFNDEDEPLGVITMNVSLNNINNFVGNTRLTKSGYGFLTNENYEIVAHPNADYITRHIYEINPSFRLIIEAMKEGHNFVKFESKNSQGRNSIFYCRLMDNGWYLGIVTPRHEYYQSAMILLLFLGILGLILTVAVCAILIRIDSNKKKSDIAFQQQGLQLALMEKMREADEYTQLVLDATPMSSTLWNKDIQLINCNLETLSLFVLKSKEEFY
jgi:methyl-accepting chemotaxis protein